MDLISSLTSNMLGKAMDGLAKRHTAITGNLANVDTPGYHRQDVQFEAALGKAMEAERAKSGQGRTSRQASNDEELEMIGSKPAHFGSSASLGLESFSPSITDADDNMSFRQDGNSVDLESEMAQLAKSTQRYNAIANIQGRRGKSLRNILNS